MARKTVRTISPNHQLGLPAVPVEGRPGVPPDGASVLTDQFGALVRWGLLGAAQLRAAVGGLRARASDAARSPRDGDGHSQRGYRE